MTADRKPPREVRAFCAVGKSGHLATGSTSLWAREVREYFNMHGDTWAAAKERGWRVIRVRIVPEVADE